MVIDECQSYRGLPRTRTKVTSVTLLSWRTNELMRKSKADHETDKMLHVR